MELGSLDGREGGGHNGVFIVEISKIIVARDAFLFCEDRESSTVGRASTICDDYDCHQTIEHDTS